MLALMITPVMSSLKSRYAHWMVEINVYADLICRNSMQELSWLGYLTIVQ